VSSPVGEVWCDGTTRICAGAGGGGAACATAAIAYDRVVTDRRSDAAAPAPEANAIDASTDGEGRVQRLLGRRIRALRIQRGLTGRALASAAGVTPGFISQLERGQVMPSVATLVRVSAALRVLVGDLFDVPADPGPVVRLNDRVVLDFPTMRFREARVSSSSNRAVEVYWGALQPGGNTGDELLLHGSDAEFVFVLSGEVDVTVGEETYRLSAGDTITFAGSSPHGCRNPSRHHPAELLWVTTPAVY